MALESVREFAVRLFAESPRSRKIRSISPMYPSIFERIEPVSVSWLEEFEAIVSSLNQKPPG